MLSNGLFNVLIGKSLSRTASVQAYDNSNSTTFLANGEVVVLDKNGAALVAGQTVADSEYIFLAQRSGATASTADVLKTMKIQGANVTSYKGLSYVAPQEQISYVGYNGTTGTIDLLNSNTYKLRVTFKHDKEMWSEQNNTLYNEYTSDSSATQSEIAAAFAKKYTNPYPAQNADIKVERVCDGTATAIGGSETLTVTNGTTTVTSSGTAHALVAGDVVRIGGAGSTVGVYIVASASGANIVLDSAYQGASATGVAANEMSSITSWGLKITGKALTFNIPFYTYLKVAFDVTIGDFGATVVTDAQAASKGNGTYEEAAQAKYLALGYDGFQEIRNNVPAYPLPNQDAVSGTNYDVITIQGYIVDDVATISGAKPAKYQVILFMVDGAAQTTNLLAQLNPWMASTPKAFANVAV